MYREMSQKFPKLSSSFEELENFYDVIIVGSGYGASIAASRCARAGQLVCVLEKGKEWLPGSFPETSATAFENMQISKNGNPNIIGKSNGLYDIVISKDITVVKGCGLGGTSLINANVVLDADENVFSSKHWPKEIRNDMKDLKEVDRKHVFKMLQPTIYPEYYPALQKIGAMEKAARSLFPDIEELGMHFKKTPLAVNFESEKTDERKYRFDQPACNGCGNCCSGCNTGAKQTLNMNYLPDAKCYGAKIFTEVAVSSVLRDEHGYVWKVKCHLNVDSKGLKRKEMTLRAHNVILGAGSLGSTQILLKSKTDGLEISNTIGSRFTGNGDPLGFCYDSSMEMNAIGCTTGKYDQVKSTSPGPCITTVIDLRNSKRNLGNSQEKSGTEKNCSVKCNAKRETATNDHVDSPFKDDIIIEDGTPPGSLSKLLKVALFLDSKKNCKHDFHKPEVFEKIFQTLLASDKLDKTLPFLCMGHDDSSGEIRTGENGDGVYIDWENVGRQQVFEYMDQKMRAITKELGGTFIQNPSWSNMIDKKLVTVHPLGGCPMGSNGREGVVNHKGEVFIGNSDSVYRGLYVMDGSIIPSPVGINPLLTISMLAERCCRLMCEQNNWKIDYDEVKDFNDTEFTRCKPGLRFTEKMSGSLTVKGTSKDVDCQFVVTITADDVEKFLNDDQHEASVVGTVECPLLSNDAVTISRGTFNLFRENETESKGEILMEYNFHLTTTEGVSYRFKGVKRRVKGGIGLHDSTTLYTELYEGGESSTLIADGILKIHLNDFMKQLRTIHIINTRSEMLKIKWTSEFGKYFFGKLWFSHGHCIASTYKDSPETGRMKRDLDIKNITPQILSFETEDQVPLMLTRYQGGTKGPLIACHGLGTNSSIFNLTTVEKNFVEYFVSNDYDVWLLDSRQSTFCPWASQSDKYALDDLAKFDFPAAVDFVLKHTQREKLQMFVHCAGAIPFWGSLLSGKLNGKIASVIVSQATPITKGSMGNTWKSWLGFTETASNFGINLVDPNSEILIYKSTFEWMKSFLPFWMLGLPSSIAGKIAHHLCPRNDNICTNGVCHRLSELYGRLYEHKNLTRETHDTLYELFGIGALGHFNQLCKCFRAGKLVDRKGNDTYLPGLDKHGKLDENARSKDWVKNVNVPILMFCGEKNRVFRPEGMQTMERVLKELHPKQDYRLILLEEYGHIDGIIGKYAVSDLWPEVLSFLDMHSHSSSANDERLAKVVAQTMHQLELIGSTADLSEELRAAICHDTTDFGFKGTKVNKDNDVPVEEVPFFEERLKGVLPNQDEYVWERKVEIHTRFEQHREYKADEKVKTYYISDDSKRTIYVLSDVHMGSSWTKDSVSELRQFESYLKGIALSTAHSVVLLGDVFDLWATPIDQRPVSLDEMKRQWMEKPTFLQVLNNFKTMAEKSNVKIFYVKGNHDHEITEQVVKELLGDDVIFIPDKLILSIKTDDQPYYMRFEHGHAYDIFNTYELTNETLKGKPIGYYVSRCAQSSHAVDAPGLLRKILYKFLSSSIGKKLGSEVVDLLARWPSLQHCLLKTIFKEALGKKSIADDTGVVMEDGSKVLINDIIKYPLFTEAKKKYGSSEVFLMLLAAAAGNYEEFLARMPEDVIVFGHTHEFKNQKSLSKSNVFHYANSGSWTDIAKCKSYICLNLPTKEQNGQVSCRFACSDDGTCSDACFENCVCPCECSH